MQLVLSKKTDLTQIYKQMQQNFCLEEIRDFAQAMQVYDCEKYHLYHLQQDGKNVGFIAIWAFDEFAFIEHFVIYAEHRNKGFGGKALDVVKQHYRQIVLEVEPPEEEMAARRFAFYKRQGFKANEYPYMQPSYRENGNEVCLILMSCPRLLDNVETVVKEIYREVYGK